MARRWKWVVWVTGFGLLGFVVLAIVLVVRTATLTSSQLKAPKPLTLNFDVTAAAERLAGAVQVETVSHAGAGQADSARFERLISFLRKNFPEVDRRLAWEVVNGGNLILTWTGHEKGRDPLVLLAHLDVVPAGGPAPSPGKTRPAEEIPWNDLAFAGRIDSGFIWGRGTLDDKVGVLAILEAIEALIKTGYQPERTVLLAFGRDEEVGGREGAAVLADLLQKRGVHAACVLDEGSYVLQKIVPGVSAPVAPVGVAEKGFADVELVVDATGGHSSQPPPHTAIGILSRAINRLEDHPLPARIDGVTGAMIEDLGPEMSSTGRLIVANLWLFRPLVVRALGASPTTNALIRTTTAVTLIQGGTKDNVLPNSARAIVNFRLLPGDTGPALLDHVRQAIADPMVQVRFADPTRYVEVTEASRVSPTNSQAYQRLQLAIRQTFPDAVVVPYVTIGGTDSRRYENLTRNVYRFLPVRLEAADLKRIHGAFERISIKHYAEAVRFYGHLIRQFDNADH